MSPAEMRFATKREETKSNASPARVKIAIAMVATLYFVGCSGDDNWQGGLRMTVNWTHYKDASGPCKRLYARLFGENSPHAIDSQPTHSCFENKGSDCNVYTDESAIRNIWQAYSYLF
jgi:hypothetical protein